MNTNLYQPPAAPLADGSFITRAVAHRRSLWAGVLAAACAPAVVMMGWGLLQDGWPELTGLLGVGIIAVVIGLLAVTTLGLPAVLVLRRMGQLRAAYVCLAAIVLGAVFGVGLMILSYQMLSDIEEGPSALEAVWRGASRGAGFGLACGLGMVLGAGIPWRARVQGLNAD